MAHKYDLSLVKPPVVSQDVTQHTCWAAAALSWIQVDPERKKLYEEVAGVTKFQDLVELMEKYVDEKGGLSKPGFARLCTFLSMQMKVVGRATRLRASTLNAILRKSGHVYMMIAGGGRVLGMPNTMGHAVVIYAMDHHWKKDPMIGAMDPWPAFGIIDRRLSVYQKVNEIVLAYYADNPQNPTPEQVKEEMEKRKKKAGAR